MNRIYQVSVVKPEDDLDDDSVDLSEEEENN